MLESLPGFIETYWKYLLGVAILCGILCYRSEKLFEYMKKGLIVFAVVFGLIAGYELVTGDSIFHLPGKVDSELSREVTNPETGRRYYKSYDERYGGDPEK